MGNHYHLFIKTPEANLVAGMSWLQNTVTRRYNVRHRAWGCLFGDRYKAIPEEMDARCNHLRRGWYWGSQDFAEKLRGISEKLIKQKKRSSRAYRKTPQVTSRSNEQAKRWLTEGLLVAGWVPKDLPQLKGSDPMKLALAELLWTRTTVSQEWIAEKLSMRSAANVSQQLRRMNKGKAETQLPPELKRFLKNARQDG